MLKVHSCILHYDIKKLSRKQCNPSSATHPHSIISTRVQFYAKPHNWVNVYNILLSFFHCSAFIFMLTNNNYFSLSQPTISLGIIIEKIKKQQLHPQLQREQIVDYHKSPSFKLISKFPIDVIAI